MDLMLKIINIRLTQREVFCNPLLSKADSCGLKDRNEFLFSQTIEKVMNVVLIHVAIVPVWFGVVK